MSGGVGQDRAHVGGLLAGFALGEILEVGARHLVQLEWKRIGGQLVERGGQLVDGVVGPRQRTVAAAIDRRDLKIGVDLLSGFHVGHHRRGRGPDPRRPHRD